MGDASEDGRAVRSALSTRLRAGGGLPVDPRRAVCILRVALGSRRASPALSRGSRDARTRATGGSETVGKSYTGRRARASARSATTAGWTMTPHDWWLDASDAPTVNGGFEDDEVEEEEEIDDLDDDDEDDDFDLDEDDDLDLDDEDDDLDEGDEEDPDDEDDDF